MTMTITPIDATLGAVVTDIDVANITDESWAEIHAAFLEYGVLVFPGQDLDEESQGAFALRFGDVEQLSPNRTARQLSSRTSGRTDHWRAPKNRHTS
jgi:alpha-ketoglutarate-dependent taurine dioxygenase